MCEKDCDFISRTNLEIETLLNQAMEADKSAMEYKAAGDKLMAGVMLKKSKAYIEQAEVLEKTIP